jgi:hypothetical protein
MRRYGFQPSIVTLKGDFSLKLAIAIRNMMSTFTVRQRPVLKVQRVNPKAGFVTEAHAAC